MSEQTIINRQHRHQRTKFVRVYKRRNPQATRQEAFAAFFASLQKFTVGQTVKLISGVAKSLVGRTAKIVGYKSGKYEVSVPARKAPVSILESQLAEV